MSDREKDWIEKLAKVKSLGRDEPHCLVQTGKSKIEIALHSELQPLLKIGDWAVITVSLQKFIIWSEIFKKIIEEVQKKH
jgi:hypothetical protein